MDPTHATTPEGACPSRDTLSAFNEGRLPLEVLEAVGRHLDSCARCGAALAGLSLDDRDGVVATVREAYGGLTPGDGPQPPGAMDVPPGEEQKADAAPPKEVPARLGQYQVFEKIGQGGMGKVYRALHLLLKCPVALKVLPATVLLDSAAVARFRQEIEAVGRLHHPHIVRATDAGEADGVHYLVLELIDGVDLGALVRGLGPLSAADSCELGRQTALGLEYVHQHRMVHRDIKPSNLMLAAEGVKVLDLGLARLYEGRPARELTSSGQVMGTCDYMAPEQWRDSRRVDIRSDLYSLGCTLYKLLTGDPPFSGPSHYTPDQKMMAHAMEPAPDVGGRRPDLPAGLAGVVSRLLAKRPADRFATPQEVAEALAPYAAGADLPGLLARARAVVGAAGPATAETIAPRGRTDASGPAPPAPRRRRPLVVAGVVAVLAAGLAGGWAAYRAQAPDAETGDALLPALREAATAMWPELTVGRWTPLLARSPDRLWPQNPTHDYFHHWAGAGATLLVKSPGLTLSALGRTAVHSYRLRTSLSQTPWTGGPGLFLGYRGWDHWGRTGYRCQVFYLKKEENRTVFRIERLLLIVWPDVDGLALTEVTQVGSAEVPRPAERQEYDLDVTVRRGVVAEVRWNGMPLKGLTGAELDRRVERADLAGPYGVYCTRGSCVFHQPAVMLLQETP